MTTGHSEAEPFWVEFLCSQARRGLRGVKLVISDAHEGLKAAITRVLSATWQRCRVHFMRNALSYAGKTQKNASSPPGPAPSLRKTLPRVCANNGGTAPARCARPAKARRPA